jgi:hypothetical protein
MLLIDFFSQIGRPFGSDPTSGMKLMSGDVFRVRTDPRETNLLTSDLRYVKRMTKKQAQRLCHNWSTDVKEDDPMGDGEWTGQLSDSDEEPSEEQFI